MMPGNRLGNERCNLRILLLSDAGAHVCMIRSLLYVCIFLIISCHSLNVFLPLHHSQKEINVTAEYSDFSYFLSPSDDFIGEILRKKDRLYVISPKELRDKILQIVKEMENNYI